MLVQMLITAAIGFLAGFILRRLGLPAGGLVGAFVGVSAFSVATGSAYLPSDSRIVVQIVAGAFIGCSISRDDVRAIRSIAKPALFMLGWYLVLTFAAGWLIFAVTPLNLPTALMSCVPGGISDVPIVAASMGANAPDVTLLQLLRLLMGIGLLPIAIKLFAKWEARRGVAVAEPGEAASRTGAAVREVPPSGLVPEIGPEASRIDLPDPALDAPARTRLFLMGAATLAIAVVAGLLGRATGIPGMTFTIASACVLAFNLKTGFAFMPKWLKRLTQYLAGAYLGTQVTAGYLEALPELAVPALIIFAAFSVSFVALGIIEHKLFGFTKVEGLFIATPAGASDMALIMDEMGVFNANVVLMQVIRLIVVLAVFPQIVNAVLFLVGMV